MGAQVCDLNAVVILFLLVCGPLMIWHGRRLLGGESIDPDSLEHLRALNRLNLLRAVLRRPKQEQLTSRQTRILGIIYVISGVICIVSAILTALGILSP